MATARIDAGICGFTTTVRTRAEGARLKVEIESDCEHIKKLAAALTEVDPFREITFRGEGRSPTRWRGSTAPTPPARCRPASSRRSRSRPAWRCPRT